MDSYDLAVLGGGINGAGIAADASGRGLRVALLEQDDLGGATSSASSKLVHGGLRYLETWEFRLVRKALQESQLLLELAPHLINPIDIYLPHQKHLRPWLLIWTGLFLYNHLASRPSYPRARSLHFDSESPLRAELTRGFSFSDGQVDDARLVVLNAFQARTLGADIYVRHRCMRLEPGADGWNITARDLLNSEDRQFHARVVVNAAGPWVSSLYTASTGRQARHDIRLVKGSHIVVPRAYAGDQAYMLQNEDGRIVFVIPYLGRYTMIGTTEEEIDGDPAAATVSEREIDYLLATYNAYFRNTLNKGDLVDSWSGVRPLIDDEEETATRASRDYQLIFEDTALPLLSVYGGKLTTYRRLAEEAVDKLSAHFAELPASRTARDCLPGGDFKSRQQLQQQLADQYPWLSEALIQRWVSSYGTLSRKILADCEGAADLGQQFGHGLSQCEVDYLLEWEWAKTAEDILSRRTGLELLFSAEEKANLARYIDLKSPLP
ncbi:MAG: glycerol-3-phosphate dehydrogenase [Gammaproteobacteria bacterium]